MGCGKVSSRRACEISRCGRHLHCGRRRGCSPRRPPRRGPSRWRADGLCSRAAIGSPCRTSPDEKAARCLRGRDLPASCNPAGRRARTRSRRHHHSEARRHRTSSDAACLPPLPDARGCADASRQSCRPTSSRSASRSDCSRQAERLAGSPVQLPASPVPFPPSTPRPDRPKLPTSREQGTLRRVGHDLPPGPPFRRSGRSM